MPQPPREPSKPNTRRALAAGITVLSISLVTMFLPLLVPLGQLARFLVTGAFVGGCIGLSIAVNAAIDLWRRR